MIVLWIVLAIVVVAIMAGFGLVLPRRSRRRLPVPPPRPGVDYAPGVGDDAEVPHDTPTRSITATVELPPTAPPLDPPEPTAGRMLRLRSRLARSQSTLGRGLLSVLSRDQLDEDAWEEVEEALLTADVGVRPTAEIVERLRTRPKVLGTRPQGGM